MIELADGRIVKGLLRRINLEIGKSTLENHWAVDIVDLDDHRQPKGKGEILIGRNVLSHWELKIRFPTKKKGRTGRITMTKA